MSSHNTVLFPVRRRSRAGRAPRMRSSDALGMGMLLIGLIGGLALGFVLARPQSPLARLGGRRPRLPGSSREPEIHMSPEYGTQTSPMTR